MSQNVRENTSGVLWKPTRGNLRRKSSSSQSELLLHDSSLISGESGQSLQLRGPMTSELVKWSISCSQHGTLHYTRLWWPSEKGSRRLSTRVTLTLPDIVCRLCGRTCGTQYTDLKQEVND